MVSILYLTRSYIDKPMSKLKIPEGTTIIDADEYEELQKQKFIRYQQQKQQNVDLKGPKIPFPIFIQLMIMVATLHASYTIYGKQPFEMVWKLLIFISAQVIRRFTNTQKKIIESHNKIHNTKNNNTVNNNTNSESNVKIKNKTKIKNKHNIQEKDVDVPQSSENKTDTDTINARYPFETVYVFFLPFMLSLLFFPNLVNINLVLMLNIFHGSFLTKLIIQLFFLLFTSYEETVLVRNFAGVILNITVNYILIGIGELKSLDIVDCNLFSILLTDILFLAKYPLIDHHDNINLPYNVIWGALLAFLVSVGFNYMLSIPLQNVKNKSLRSLVLFTAFISNFPFLINWFVDVGENVQVTPVKWLFNYVLKSKIRQRILITWLLFIFLLIPNILILKSNFSLNTSRKLWHYLILILIIQPFKWDATFVKISLAGTIVLFLSVEYLRYLKLEPLGKILDEKLRSFADFRDERGPIIISYIYLIVGISAPLLIADSPVGLISLGVGDSTASIIGKRYGEFRWPDSNKTIEGTFAFILTTFVTGYICKQYLGYFEHLTVGNWLLVCTLSGVLEGNSILNDNILIPAFMMICEKLFSN